MFVCLDAPSPAAPPSFPFSLAMTSAGGRPPRAPIAASPLRVEARLPGGAAAEVCSRKAGGEWCSCSPEHQSLEASEAAALGWRIY